MSEKRKILVSKVRKQGIGRTIGSRFHYGSIRIDPTTVEIEIDPPLDLTDPEDKEVYKKIQDTLTKMAHNQLENELAYYQQHNEDLHYSLEKIDSDITNFKRTQEGS